MCDEDFEFELTEEDIAEIKRSMQDANDGFTYEMLTDEDGLEKDEEGNRTMRVKCNKCDRIGTLLEKPFPHKFDCEMRRRFGD